jgi:SAM-dependent methyltransferase
VFEHDAPPGPLKRCQISGSEDLHLVIDLGHQPPCDSLVENLDAPERTYPLRLYQCPRSGLAQLDYVVDGREIYPASYPYRSGISKPLEDYQRAFADGVVYRFGIGKGDLVVDIGSNDGTLLTGFLRHDCQALGVEPTDVAKIARADNGVETIQEFFTEELAKRIVADRGGAHVITMTNVFAHMAPLGEVMRGICTLLRKGGIFITESHYLLDVLAKNQFDTIYHEHIRTYSLKSLWVLASMYGLEVFHVERGERYGGNIRAYLGRAGERPVSRAVGDLLEAEESAGLFDPNTWKLFRARVLNNRDRMMEFLYATNRAGFSIAGNSCPGRAATLINFYGITPDLVPYLGELHNSLKLGKYLPGAHIPIVSNRRIIEEQPEYLVLFSWHYADVIIKRLRSEGVRSKIVLPLPEFRVID